MGSATFSSGAFFCVSCDPKKKHKMSKKGHPKNTKNKSKHTKLMTQKKNKLKSTKELRKERLKEIIAKSKEE